MINSEQTIAKYIEAKRHVKKIVIQEKHNRELSIARTIPKASTLI